MPAATLEKLTATIIRPQATHSSNRNGDVTNRFELNREWVIRRRLIAKSVHVEPSFMTKV